jgi:hypothetical protein
LIVTDEEFFWCRVDVRLPSECWVWRVQCRQDVAHMAAATAERAAVLIAGPLGLCFLPAFVCLGIVPVVAGLAGDLLQSGLL